MKKVLKFYGRDADNGIQHGTLIARINEGVAIIIPE